MFCGGYQVQGTVFPNPNCDPMIDAQLIGGALQGFGCDKDVLIDILTQRSSAQRIMIAEAYGSLYGRNLLEDLRENLDGHFKEVMVGLMYAPPAYDAHELWHAMKGAGTDENCLIDILASRTTSDIFQLKEAYLMQYGNNLDQDIYSETSGHFRDALINLAQGVREEGYVDPGMAAQDAMVLWEACQRRTGEHKNMMQMILCNKSHQQLWMDYCAEPGVKKTDPRTQNSEGSPAVTHQANGSEVQQLAMVTPICLQPFASDSVHNAVSDIVFQEFQNVSGQDIAAAIEECYDGYFQQLLLAIVSCVRDKPSYFAYRLYSAIHDFGFHNKTIIRTIVARSEIDLLTIRQRYKERYGKSLFHDIKHFASGHYEKALLAICAGDGQDF